MKLSVHIAIIVIFSSFCAYSQTPSIQLSDNGTQVAAANVSAGTSRHVLLQVALRASNNDANITSLTVTTTGNYVSNDITSIEAIYSTDATLDNFDFVMSTYLNPGIGGSKPFPLFSGTTIYNGNTGYIFVVATISCTAGGSRSIGCNAITLSQLGSDALESGSCSNGGLQTFVTPAVQLGDNNQVATGNIAQGATNHILNSVFLRVTSTTDVTLSGMTCTTAGDGITNYQSADLTNLKVWFSTDATWHSTDVLLSTFTTPGGPGNKTFPSFTAQKITAGTYGYIFITADLANNAVANRKIRVNALTASNFTLTCNITASGSASAGGIQTITAPSISIGNNVSQPSNANVSCGTTAHVLHKTTITVSNAAATLTAMQCFVVGTYQTSDITNLKVRYSTDATLDASDATLSTITSIATGSASVKKVFSPFTSQQISVGSGYIFITADISSSATSRNININALVAADFTFAVGTPTVSTSAGGVQTFVVPGITIGNNGSQPGNASVNQGTKEHVLQRITLTTNSTGSATLSGLNCTTTGTYNATDIVNLKAIYSTNATLDAGDVTLSTLSNPGVAGSKTFTSFISQTIPASTTVYLFITADIFPAAYNRTISINGLTSSNVLFNGGNVTSSSSNCGTQTFSGIAYANIRTVSSTNDSGAGSLREAITNANSNTSDIDYICFNFGGVGPYTINLTSTLTLSGNITIDGFENGDYDGTANTVSLSSISTATPVNHDYRVILSGTSGTQAIGLTLSGNNNILKGLVIQNFGDGTINNDLTTDINISITGNYNRILGCIIGLNYLGVTGSSRSKFGVKISGNYNAIGDGTASGINIISGMTNSGSSFTSCGIYITGTSQNDTIKGNIIGLQKDGFTIVSGATQKTGIMIDASGTNNIIGGETTGHGNIISGNYGGASPNDSRGVTVGSSTKVQGNIIGLAADGNTHVASQEQLVGLAISGNGNTIGGSGVAKNVISGNLWYGVSVGGNSNTIKGNYIGLNSAGTTYIANSSQNVGIYLTGAASGNTIGGTSAADANVISGNGDATTGTADQEGGIILASTNSNTIIGNIIGPQADGLNALATNYQINGIYIMNSTNNVIGGSANGERNIISANKYHGIKLFNNTSGNIIKGNYIGPDINGTAIVAGATQSQGIRIESAGANTIGGPLDGEENVLSGNYYGIFLTSGATNNNIKGNIIGLQKDAASYMASNIQYDGIVIMGSGNIIGGTTADDANIISGNNENGIKMYTASSTNNTIIGNKIGPTTSLTSVTATDAQENGIYIYNGVTNTKIGGSTADSANTICYNANYGINIEGTTSTGHRMRRNLIYRNGSSLSCAINLNLATANESNNGKPAPSISSFSLSQTNVQINGTAQANDIVEIYYTTESRPYDATEYLGTTIATAEGTWTFNTPRSTRALSGSSWLLAAATDGAGAGRNTSELRSGGAPLPINLLSFDATCSGNHVEIKWTTASETNNDYFTIERTVDGVNDKKEFIVKGSGTVTQATSYSLIDNNPIKGTAYYRLKQTDFDGKFEYFDFVSVSCKEETFSDMNIYPNPSTGEYFNLSVPVAKDTEVVVVVYDVNGRESYSKVLIPENDETAIFGIDLENKLSPGIYVIIATSNKNVYKKRLIVK